MVCSTDILLAGSLEGLSVPSPGGDILLYTVPATLAYATAHGVAVINKQDSSVENILYQPTMEEIRL
jgi:hypothetical protein